MKWVDRLLAGGIGLLALGVVATGVIIGIIAWAPTPIWDQWDAIAPEQLAGKLFAPHNEHRIIMSRLIFWADITLAQGTGVISLAFVYIYNAAHLVLLLVLAGWTWPQAERIRLVAAGAVAAAFFFSGFQFENFVSGFQNQFTGVFFFASAAIVSLCIAASREDRWRKILIATSAGFAAIGAASMANGLLIAPLLVVLALLLGLRASAWIMGLVAAVTWVLYFRGFPAGDDASLISKILSHPVGFVGNVLAYAGGAAPNSISALLEPFPQKVMLARAFGAIALLSVGVLALIVLRKPVKERPRLAAWAAIGVFVFASAAVTALGRTGFGDLAMLSNRYGAATAALWSVIAVFAIMSARGPVFSLGLAAAAALTLLLARTQLEWTYSAQVYKFRKMDAQAALLSDVDAPAVYASVYPDPNRVRTVGQLLRKRSLAMFHQPWQRLYGERISPSANVCSGEVIETGLLTAASQPSWRISAYGDVPPASRAIAVTDEQGGVVGLLVRGTSVDRASWFLDSRERPRWSGFVRLATPRREKLSLMPVDASGSALCRFEEGIDVDPTNVVRLVSGRLVGNPLATSSEPVVEGVFALDAHHESAGRNPWGGRSWGSWAGDDANTGVITVKANVEGIDRVAVPVVTGPGSSGLGIEVKVDGVALTMLQAPADLDRWSAIEIAIPPGAKELEITARDASSAWGGWIAIGEPHLICAGSCGEKPCPSVIGPDDIIEEASGGVVDELTAANGMVEITGWAADVRAKEPVDHVVVAIEGAVLACQKPNLARPDVARSLNVDTLGQSGFSFAVKSSDVARLRVYSQQSNGAFAPLKLPRQ
jgi:hypothetical protein